MPNFVSNLGKWSPRKERVVNPDAEPGQEIYEGPDRAAVEVLQAAGVEYLGQDYHLNPDLIRQSRELGYKSVDSYLKEMFGFDPEKAAEQIKKLQGEVIDHRPTRTKSPVRVESGGDDWSGQGRGVRGGFGDHTEVLKKK